MPNTAQYSLGKALASQPDSTLCRVTYGNSGHYIAWSTGSNWAWRSKALPNDVKQVVANKTARIGLAALGVDDAYFVQQVDGRFWYGLRGNYDGLEAILADLRNGDIEVSGAATPAQANPRSLRSS